MVQICGNFAKDGECGTCEHFGLVGVCLGVCCEQDYIDKMCKEKCDCEKYKKREKKDGRH